MCSSIAEKNLLSLPNEVLLPILKETDPKGCWGVSRSCHLLYYAVGEHALALIVSKGLFSRKAFYKLDAMYPHLTNRVRFVNLYEPSSAKDMAPLRVFRKILSFRDKKRVFSCTSLEKIRFPYCPTNKDIDAIVQNFKHLREVDLQFSQITDEKLTILVTHCRILTKIDLSFCTGYTSKGLRAVADNSPELEELCLEDFSDLSINEVVIYFLRKCPRLERLNLGQTPITMTLIDVLSRKQYALKYLDLHGDTHRLLPLFPHHRHVIAKVEERGIQIRW